MRTIASMLILGLVTASAESADDVNEAVERAIKQAAQRVAPTVVAIQTAGGAELIRPAGGGPGKMPGPGRGGPPQGPGLLKGTGATTGLIISSDGHIITSSFNFANKPTDITVSIPGRERLVAKVIATDTTRFLTLLKVDARNLPVPTPYPKAQIETGQWAVALGRTLDPNVDHLPSLSIGIISAKNRIWGKAIQTDAKVSPVNYGGPLVALDGRVFGVLVPASTRGEDEVAGVEWYDSGIGFAVPLEDILAVLPRMKEGTPDSVKVLRRGLLGVTPKSGGDMYNAPAVIGDILPGSAAERIGLKPGDTITRINGIDVPNYSTVMHLLGPKYEGDVIELRIKREDKEEVFPQVTLTGSVTASSTAFLGILPLRDDPGPGVPVRYVYPDSPAAKAGIQVGDRILKIGPNAEKAPLVPVSNRDALIAAISRFPVNAEVKIELQRKGADKTETITAKLVEATARIPDQAPLPSSAGKALQKAKTPAPKGVIPIEPKKGLPIPPPKKVEPQTGFSFQDEPKPTDDPKKDDPKGPADVPSPKEKPPSKTKVETGLLKRSNNALGREYWVYVPDNYDPNVSHGLMVWFHDAGRGVKDAEDMKTIWGDFCEDHHFILMGPKSQNSDGWVASETEAVMMDVKAVIAQYTIDRSRVVAHGMGVGGQMAFYVSFNARDTFRGCAVVGAVLGNPPKDKIPNQPLSFFMAAGDKDPLINEIRESREALEEKKYPVIYREMKDTGKQYLLTDIFEELQRWMDSLDAI